MTNALFEKKGGKGGKKSVHCHLLSTYYVPEVVLGIFRLFSQYLERWANCFHSTDEEINKKFFPLSQVMLLNCSGLPNFE